MTIAKLVSYKSNLIGFKYLYKYNNKQTGLPLPRRSSSSTADSKTDGSVGALRDSEDSATKLKDNSTTQRISFNKSHSEYPAAFQLLFLLFCSFKDRLESFLYKEWLNILVFNTESDKERLGWL